MAEPPISNVEQNMLINGLIDEHGGGVEAAVMRAVIHERIMAFVETRKANMGHRNRARAVPRISRSQMNEMRSQESIDAIVAEAKERQAALPVNNAEAQPEQKAEPVAPAAPVAPEIKQSELNDQDTSDSKRASPAENKRAIVIPDDAPVQVDRSRINATIKSLDELSLETAFDVWRMDFESLTDNFPEAASWKSSSRSWTTPCVRSIEPSCAPLPPPIEPARASWMH